MQLNKITKPSKQRKILYEATDHVRHRFFATHLSPELRSSHLVKTFPVRSGDTVRIMRGDHKGFEGKVTRIGKRKYRIYVEGLTREKVDGTTIFVPIHPSKVMITNLNLDDKWRKKVLEGKKSWQTKQKETRRRPGEHKVETEQPVEFVKTKPPAVKKKALEEHGVEEEKTLSEKELVIEKAPAEEKPHRKKTTKARRKASKKTTARETKTESKESEKKKKPRTEKKRKTAKKTERGE